MRLLFRTVIAFLILLLFILPASCSDTETTASEKISSLLLTQVNLKKEQIDNPTTERLEMMVTDNPSFQSGERVVIFLNNSQGIFTVFGGFQGKFTVDKNNMVSGNKQLTEFISEVRAILAKP